MEQTKLETALEIIDQGVFEIFPDRDKNGKCTNKDEANSVETVNDFLDIAQESYVLVNWPESQEYMDESWFTEEAILHFEEASAYFIPLKRVLK